LPNACPERPAGSVKQGFVNMFREDKATQLAAYLIEKAGGRSNYTTLQKMMYDCDREMILEWGMPVTYDTWVSMKMGPVLSTTLDLIKGVTKGSGYWLGHIAKDGYDVIVKAKPGDGALSDAELAIADKAFAEFGHLDYSAASERAHSLFKEWIDPGDSKRPITASDILRVNGREDPEYLREVQEHYQLNDLLAR